MNPMARILVVALLAVPFLRPAPAEAQLEFGAEGKAGVTFPTGDLSDAGAEAGLALGAELIVNFRPNLSAYVGLNRHGFSCESDCNVGDSPRSSGLGAGLKFVFPSPPDALLWGRAGIVAHSLATDDGSGDRNIGFEGGAGFDMPIRDRLFLSPHLSFITHDVGGGASATYFNFGVGAHYHF